MSAFEILAALLTVAASFAYLNHRLLRLPPAIALMAMAMATSILLIALDRLGWPQVRIFASRILDSVDLDDTLLHGMLGVLLFAGALHIPLRELHEQRLAVAALAVGATVISTALVAVLAYVTLLALGMPLPFKYCLLFGALISPTDPIAVMGILKSAGVPRAMEIQIAGESLFNDGLGVVIFVAALGLVAPEADVTPGRIALLLAREAGGGVLFGLASGYVTYRLLRSIDHYQTELLLTLALVFGGYAVAEHLHISAPIAAVVAGLVIGNVGRAQGMSETTRDHLDKFWSLIDEILNAALFVLVGFELVRLSLERSAVLGGLCLIPIVLVARLASVAGPVAALSWLTPFPRGSVLILAWGGLRGGISLALALSTPPGPAHDRMVVMTYVVVAFSIFVQGLTVGPLARRLAVR